LTLGALIGFAGKNPEKIEKGVESIKRNTIG
jgi:hypothetical protein